MNFNFLLVYSIAFLVAVAFSAYSWNRLRPVSYIIMGWFVVAFGFSRFSYFQSPTDWQEGDLIGLLAFSSLMTIPVICLIVAWQKSPRFKTFLRNIPTWLLVSSQVYRIGGALYLVGAIAGELPMATGLVNGVLDIVVSTSAILLGWLVFKNIAKVKNWILAWSALGLLDIMGGLIIVTFSFFGLVDFTPAPTLMGMAPITMVCIFQVPLAIFIQTYLIHRGLYEKF